MQPINQAPIINSVPATQQGSMSETKKFWNIANVSENSAELILYGPIVIRRPVDFWTGEFTKGLYITPEEFLNDLAEIRDKQNVTIRINSVGGDFYTALAIYTQLKSLPVHKEVIVDGIAASGATIIAMAGDIIKIPAGSLFMVHEALAGVQGYINHKALMEIDGFLEVMNKAVAETYANKVQKDIKEIRAVMLKETWMTGREAVEAGFADEVLFDSEPQMSLSADKKLIMVNGIRQSLAGLQNIPGNIPIIEGISATAAPQAEINIYQGGKPKVKNATELQEAYPELVAQIESAAHATGRKEGEQAEKERIKAIEGIQAAIGDESLLTEAKYGEKPCTAAELAFNALQKQAELGKAYLDSAEKDFKGSGADGVGANGNVGLEPQGVAYTNDDATAIAQAAALIAGAHMKKEEK